MSTSMIFAAAALAGAAYVSAQAAPNWEYIPAACASDCSQTAEIAYLCENEYTSTTDIYGCFCNSFPSDASTCATCLNNNDAAALASLITSDITECPAAIESCFFQCSFDTCSSSDIPCQCDSSYLQNIYNCGACNTANGNTGATQLSDWQSLHDSCQAQNYTAAASGVSYSSESFASPTGQANYVSVTLTASGGGEAATGSVAASGIAPTTLSGAQSAVSTAAAAAGVSVSASKASSGAASGTSAAASVSSSNSAAKGLAAPAVGVLAVAGAVIALF